MGFKISKSIILPKIPQIDDLNQLSKLFHDIEEAIEEHNLVNYEDSVEAQRSMTFINLVANAGLTLINGGAITTNSLTADKYHELRNTYVFNGDDSLDATFPFELDFEIVSEMTAINKVLLSFRISQFRAYSVGAASGGGQTSSAGGAQTSSAGGGQTSASENRGHMHKVKCSARAGTDGTNVRWYASAFVAAIASDELAVSENNELTHTHTVADHTHTVADHTHTVADHTHTVVDHTHTVAAHTHGITYGIFEDSQSPTIHYHVDNGAGYGAASGNFNTDQLDIDITALITTVGFKRIKFDSNARCRIRAWVMCKVDLTA